MIHHQLNTCPSTFPIITPSLLLLYITTQLLSSFPHLAERTSTYKTSKTILCVKRIEDNLQNPRQHIQLNRVEPIAAVLRNFDLDPDAQQPHPSGRTAMPPISVRLTLRITSIPTPTGWTISLDEHFPDLQMIPTPPPPTPLRHSPMLRGGNRISHSPQRYHRTGAQPTQLAARISTLAGGGLRQTTSIPVHPEWNDNQNISRDSGTFVLYYS